MRYPHAPHLIGAAVALSALACGSTSDESSDDALMGTDDEPTITDDGPATSGPDEPAEPQDYSDGMAMSVTGHEEADNRAIPCSDLDSGWAGDELCILPPDPSEGFQYHVGPDDYDDPDQIESFILGPGSETVECYWKKIPLDHDIYNRQRNYRMRPGSHHLILKKGDPVDDGWGACPGGLSGSFGGSQNSIADTGFGEVAPEDAGYASFIEASQQGAAEMHYFNASDEPVLRDIWVNFYEADPDTVTGTMNGIALIGLRGLQIGPHSTKTIRYGCDTDVDRRVAGVVGHVHAHTTRFSAWTVRGTERELIYDLYDWAEPAGLDFNSIAENPEPGIENGLEGGHSGLLELTAGDRIEWECEVVNDLDTTLVFGNEALTAEMCILFGSTPQSSWRCIPDPL